MPPTPIPRPTQPSDVEHNKAVMATMLEAFNTGNIDTIPDLLHADAQDNSTRPDLGGPPAPAAMHWGSQVQTLMEAFPDGQYGVDTMVAEGDTVILRWVFTGTHLAPLFGREPTGRQVAMYGYEIDRFQNGKIIDHTDDDSPVFSLLTIGVAR